jgi:hypothetical protein
MTPSAFNPGEGLCWPSRRERLRWGAKTPGRVMLLRCGPATAGSAWVTESP